MKLKNPLKIYLKTWKQNINISINKNEYIKYKLITLTFDA